MTHISTKLIEQLPKTDLHCHFDGSIRLNTFIELAKKRNVSLPSYDPLALMEMLKFGRVRKTLEEYLLGFDYLVAVLQHKEDIERAFFEICEDAAMENVWHLELRYCPLLHIKQGLTTNEVVESCIKAANRAMRELGISVRHILCGLKHNENASILAMAKLAAEYRDQGVVAFDLAGPEIGYPIRDNLEAIYFAKRNHLYITLHAGESFGLRASRKPFMMQEHNGLAMVLLWSKDPKLLSYVVDHRIGVECCPISNWHTGSVKSLDEHPLKLFLQAGVRASINTDNRLCSDTTVTEEIMAVCEHSDLSLADIKRVLINGFKSAFLPYEQRAELLRNLISNGISLCPKVNYIIYIKLINKLLI